MNQERLRTYQESVGIDCYVNANDLLNNKNVEIVIIATPHNTHLELVKQALDKGKKVLLEKPLAHTSVAAKEIVELSRKHPTKIGVNMTHRFRLPVQKGKELIAQNKIGQVKKVTDTSIVSIFKEDLSEDFWLKDISGGGVDYTNGIHLLDRILFVLKSPKYNDYSLFYEYISGTANNKNHRQEVNDEAKINIKIHGAQTDINALFDLRWLNKNLHSMERNKDIIEIEGERGKIIINVLTGLVEVIKDDKTVESYPTYDSENVDKFFDALKKVHRGFCRMAFNLDFSTIPTPAPEELEHIHEIMEAHQNYVKSHQISYVREVKDFCWKNRPFFFAGMTAIITVAAASYYLQESPNSPSQ